MDSKRTRLSSALDYIRGRIFSEIFLQVYEFIEFSANLNVRGRPCFINDGGKHFALLCNKAPEQELSAFRFADTKLVKISNEEGRGAIEKALQQGKYDGVRAHISAAAALYTQSPTPDYRNSIKGSISAVESAIGYIWKRN